jgi:hypothetical protein
MYSLHPVSVDDVKRFLALCEEPGSRRESIRRGSLGWERLRAGDSRGPDLVSHALAWYLAEERVSFASEETNLTHWEASIERGIGMLLRPPARLFMDAGMDRDVAQSFPIRLDLGKGTMAGAFVPAHLIGRLEQMLDERLDRQLRRMIEAEIDAVANMGWMMQAVAWARANGFGLLEAADVVGDGVPMNDLVEANRKQLPVALRKRLEAAARPPRKPSLVGRLLGARTRTMQAQVEARRFNPDNGWHDGGDR